MLSCLKCLLPKPGRFIKSFTKSRSPIANPNPTPEVPINQAEVTLQSAQPDTFSRTSAQSAQPDLPNLSDELFGTDLKSIHFQQGQNTNTCYLLSALDNIFQHPQGQRILDLIPINRIENGYEVKFPGQPHPITVLHDELGKYVQSKTRGVEILEQAFINTGVDPMQEDSTYNALVRMFGRDRLLIQIPGFEETPLAASAQTQDLFADIRTGVEQTLIKGGYPKTGRHFFSINSHPENLDQFNVVNPLNTRNPRVVTQDQLSEQFAMEITQIRLNP
jgi:hypothetical protein